MDDLFFYASKLFWAFASPDHLLLLLFTLAVFISRPKGRDSTLGKTRGSRRLLWLTLCITWVIALYPVGNLLLYPLENRFQRPVYPGADEIAGVIVLGGPEKMTSSDYWDSFEVNEAGERILEMLVLLKQYPDLPFIYTGGSGEVNNQHKKGADLVRGFLSTLELQDRLVYERQSRNTYENAVFSAELVKGGGAQPWLLVTSAFHMPRSVGVFEQQGVNVQAYPVDHWSLPPAHGTYFDLTGNLSGLKMAIREWLGLTAYWLTGKTATFLPGNDSRPKALVKATHE